MSKLSLHHLGLNAEIHEKTNVMTPFNCIVFSALPLAFISLISVNLIWVKIFSCFMIFIVVVSWVIVYLVHSVKNPELLQSETYRIEQHKIEAGMITNKDELLHIPEKLTTNITPLIETNNSEDIKE